MVDHRSGKSSVPLREFRGWLKCQRPHHKNALGELVTSTTYPLFDVAGSEASRSDLEVIAERVAREEGFSVLDMPPVRFRRFAGDSKGVLSLDRGRYYTVCMDGSGLDSGTLVNEFNAYCNPQQVGFALAVDQSVTDPPQPAVAVFLKDLAGAPSQALAEARSQGLLPADADSVHVDIPYEVSEHAIERVLDLRYPDARQWLFDEFSAGKPGVVKRMGEKLPAEATFRTMLPSLMIRDNGGDSLTNIIGAYLRRIGVGGLVFPSARSDVFVEFRNGELVDFGGWNLVDYRDATSEPLDEEIILFGEWVGFRDRSASGLVDPSTKIRFAPSGSEFDGSFRVEGNESHHRLLLHTYLCFRIWGEAGFDTPVRAYRWHSTRAFRHRKGVFRRRKGTVFVATCLDCRAKSPRFRSIEDLLALPSACPKCGYRELGNELLAQQS